MEVDKIKKAVIPAAGLGSRFYPLTRMYPKELLPVVDKPVIHYVVEEALNSGIEEILIIVGPQKQAIINYFYGNEDEKNFIKGGEFITPDVNFVCQREPRGLADSLAYAKKFVGSDPFLVLLGDTFYESYNERTVSAQIIETYLRWKSPVVAIEKIGQADLSSYGVVDAVRIFENVWNIKNFIEKPSPNNAPSDMGMVGIYVLEGEIFDHIHEVKAGVDGEYQLTDALQSIAYKKRFLGREFGGKTYNIGSKEMWINSFIEIARRDEKFKNHT